MENRRFRTALGGFHRQDVLDYIENAAREAQELLDESKQACRMLEAESGDLRMQLAAQTARVAALEAERDALASACEDREILRAALDEAHNDAAAAGEELSRLRKRLDEAEPDAAAYREIRERLAAVEIDAHRRAAEIEHTAAAEAEALRAQLALLLAAAKNVFDAGRTDYESTAAHIIGELERVKTTLLRAGEKLEPVGEKLRELKIGKPD